ncbi:glycosyltransferase GtfB domain protein [Mycobacterium xenopi 4042]|uniref:Glycosyltransferase GtfB domain protein n=1 Tax=Mycobacterium xenopi 4042 TaxID=1299334 RepID=X8BFS3_MYCXE|nr:glycosyltransferase GtfB domain protein [Mycobacterium xenopi 3993]EUA42719.1 glycosyltransferase GtfB domain protein [Mycobacterium xenopi 4042]
MTSAQQFSADSGARLDITAGSVACQDKFHRLKRISLNV